MAGKLALKQLSQGGAAGNDVVTYDAATGLWKSAPAAAATSTILESGGRLTLTTALPVTTADVTAAGTLYYTPYVGGKVPISNGTAVTPSSFTERSLVLTGLLTSGKNYDVFIYDNAGTLTLELSAAWTSDTARADALSRLDGYLVKDSAKTRLYLGTIRASGTDITQDSIGKRFVWNMYNRVPRRLYRTDTTASWTYGTATWRSANNSTANRVEMVIGVSEDVFRLRVDVNSRNAGTIESSVSIDEDGTTNPDAEIRLTTQAPATNLLPASAEINRYPVAGYHFYQWIEWSSGVDSTFFGSGTGTSALHGAVNG